MGDRGGAWGVTVDGSCNTMLSRGLSSEILEVLSAVNHEVNWCQPEANRQTDALLSIHRNQGELNWTSFDL